MGKAHTAAEALPLQSGNAYSEEIIKSCGRKRLSGRLREKNNIKLLSEQNRVVELEDQVDDLQFRIEPHQKTIDLESVRLYRKCMHFVIRQKDRLKNCGDLSGVIAKVRYKSWKKEGDDPLRHPGFRPQRERQKQEAAVFERMPKISILVPLVEHAGKLF